MPMTSYTRFLFCTNTPRQFLVYILQLNLFTRYEDELTPQQRSPCTHFLIVYYYQALRVYIPDLVHMLVVQYENAPTFVFIAPTPSCIYSTTERFQSVRRRTHTITKKPPLILLTLVLFPSLEGLCTCPVKNVLSRTTTPRHPLAYFITERFQSIRSRTRTIGKKSRLTFVFLCIITKP